MSSYFITGIHTGAGKTVVTASLAHQLKQSGEAVRALKPIISGYEETESDTALLMQSSGETDVERVSPWRFEAPLSPHLAAAKEGRDIDPFALVQWCQKQMAEDGTTLIEGVGGIMVPMAANYTVLDWMKALDIPVVLVSSSYLGAINHTLMSIETVLRAGLVLQGIIVSQSEAEVDAGLEDTISSIRSFMASDYPILSLPRLPESNTPWQSAPNLLSVLDG